MRGRAAELGRGGDGGDCRAGGPLRLPGLALGAERPGRAGGATGAGEGGGCVWGEAAELGEVWLNLKCNLYLGV